MKPLRFLLTCLAGIVPALLLGCGSQYEIQIAYARPAEYPIGENVRTLAVNEFGGRSEQDQRWGDVASDKLAAALHEASQKFSRYTLIDRKRLRAMLDEQDLQLAMGDPDSVNAVGKMANAQAIIYGSVTVDSQDTRGTRSAVSLRGKTRAVSYVRRTCSATVNFTMNDPSTGETLAAVNVSRDFDSERDKEESKIGKAVSALGFGGDSDLPVEGDILTGLIEQCVNEFVAKISPHEVVVTEILQKGAAEIVETGNKLAMAGDHDEALELYQAAIKANPADHGAAFNAGVMCEATGRFEQAEAHYDKAFKIEPKQRYVLARKRVRLECELQE